MMNQIITLLSADSFVRILLVAVALDTILGVLRAIKEHKFNSSVGIDGAIRKTAMLTSTGLLMAIDVIMHTNVLFMVPETYIKVLGISKLGICEFFCLLFILYELVSILKNMTLCGLPVPSGVKKWIQKFLEDMTEELPEDAVKNIEIKTEPRTEGE
jgi:toxin secretion/phage lysis holin|nr:MAG TPA: holin [Caudoviricetes sp.]